ncbi:putative zinc-binding protein [uncultured Acetobacterium sp.]|uniref:putative zinc-binding protein n=1 Tax=uncultured Acetobacterium sp. TaxID=217139 RepID=UPI0025DE8011|nr:putative zinc-binding protein [uncultured Acetobacterium sp.]MDP2843188.1 putative zinc-binding protein [Acetobacterium sp.]
MSKIKVIPCSGIGKVFGLLARESVLMVTEEKCPDECETLCLAHVVTGDDEVVGKINGENCITMDGCAKYCAKKSVEETGGIVVKSHKVPDYIKAHRGEEHGTGTYLTDDGWKYAEELAEIMVEDIKEIKAGVN